MLPPDLVRSPYHSIAGPVTVDGFLDRYQMQTKYGTFTVLGTDLLRMRVREVAATAHLEEINGADTLVTSAGKTALKPLGTVKDLVTAPGKTVSDTVHGVGNIFGQVDAGISATDPNREGTIASLTGGSKARRKLAYDFGVDPYTTFEPLNAELKRVASASAIGETATNAGLAFVTGGAGIAISVGGTSSDLREALRDKSAADLEKMGHEELAAMGVSEGAIAAFYATQWLTPTDKAVIVEAMMHLGNAGQREIFIARTAQAKTYAEGFAYRRKAELTAAYQQRVASDSVLHQCWRHAADANRGPESSPLCPWTICIGARSWKGSFPTPALMEKSGSPAPRASSPRRTWQAAAGRSCPMWLPGSSTDRAFAASLSFSRRRRPRARRRRHRLHHGQARHVDDRDVVAVAVGHEQQLFVGREGKLPDPLPHQQILLDFQLLGVDDRDVVGGTQARRRRACRP